jgi:hypothetical protein
MDGVAVAISLAPPTRHMTSKQQQAMVLFVGNTPTEPLVWLYQGSGRK